LWAADNYQLKANRLGQPLTLHNRIRMFDPAKISVDQYTGPSMSNIIKEARRREGHRDGVLATTYTKGHHRINSDHLRDLAINRQSVSFSRG
jgi:hypothetical protein